MTLPSAPPSPDTCPAGPIGGSHHALPAGAGLALDRSSRRYPGGIVIGGSPVRVMRLTAAGDRLFDRLVLGEAVPPTDPAARLARRMFDTGIAHPRPALASEAFEGRGRPGAGLAKSRLPAPTNEITVVIPVRDRPGGLAVTLTALGPAASVIVVDDGSEDPATVLAVAAASGRRPGPGGQPHRVTAEPPIIRSGVTVLRNAVPAGPASARNTGWRAASTELVAFVDADCQPRPDWLHHLLPHFSDPTVAAVAPRIVSRPAPGAPAWLVAYETARCCLDLGGREAPVRPRSWVPYVPTAALVVRRSALEDIGGFEEDLQTGEDVDLVWRMHAAGWRVRYQPAATVAHPVRPSLGAWMGQRAGYGRSAAPLARRHGSAVAPLDLSPWSAGAWALVAAGHPLAGIAVAALSAAVLARTTAPASANAAGVPAIANRKLGNSAPLPTPAVLRLAALGHLRAGEAMATALVRAWWPLTAVAVLTCRRARRVVVAATLVRAALDWARRRPDMGFLRWLLLHLVDDLAYGAGLWAGCARERSLAALRPAWSPDRRQVSLRRLPGQL